MTTETQHLFRPSLAFNLCTCGRIRAHPDHYRFPEREGQVPDQAAARDEGLAHVELGSFHWRLAARAALREVAETLPELTSDDVWHVLRARSIPKPGEPRAMGPVMLKGVRDGWLIRTNRTHISDDPASPNHRRPQTVYLSRLTS